MIHESFVDLRAFSPLAGPLYLASFMFLFMYVVLNVFLSLVEESFATAKEQEVRDEVAINIEGQLGTPRGEAGDWVEGVKANLRVMAVAPGGRRNFQVLKEFIDSELAKF